MKRSALKIVLVIQFGLVLPACAANGNIYRFDFGTEKSPVFADFVGIHEKTVYNRDKGYGWSILSKGQKREHFDRQRYDDLCRDLVLAQSSTFNLDLADGQYLVNIWIGDLNNLLDYLRFGITAEGRGVYRAEHINFETYCDFYFRNSNHYYSKNDDPWDLYIAPRFVRRKFIVDVTDGQLNIQFKNCRINGIVVCPVSRQKQTEKEILLIEAQRRQQFESNWKEVKEPTSDDLEITPAIRKKGYAVFSRGWMEDVYPQTSWQNEDIVSELSVMCAQNEYEPTSFCVTALEDLQDVRIMVEHLFDKDQVKFDTRNIDVRLQRYRLAREKSSMTYSAQPAQIAQFRDVDIEQGVTRKFWLDVHVPKGTKPGIYEGVVWIKPKNKPATKIKLTLSALGFELLWDKDRHNYALQYPIPEHYREFSKDKSYWDYLKLDWEFMKRFGITMPTLGYEWDSWPVMKWNSVTKEVENIDLSGIEKTMQVYEEVGGFISPYIIYCTYAMTGNRYYALPLKRDAKGWARSDQEQAFWSSYKRIVQSIKDKQVEKNWPEFVFLSTGEMSNGGLDHIRYGKKILNNLKEINGIKVAAMTNSWKELETLAPCADIAGMQIVRCTDKAVEYGKKRSRGNNFWIYQSDNRFIYGYYFHKTGAKGSFKEDYQSAESDPYNGFDGRYDEISVITRYSLPSRNGPVPLSRCYQWREGIDDARYLYTLEEAIRKTEKSPDPKARHRADQARKILGSIMGRVNLDLTYYRHEVGFWDNPVYDILKKRIADEITELGQFT